MPTSVPKQSPLEFSGSAALRQQQQSDVLTYLLGTLCGFLQVSFSQRPINSLRWDPEIKHTEVVITADAPLDLESCGERPAVVVMLGPINQMNTGLDDMSELHMGSGVKIKRMLMAGSYSVQCLARVKAESQRLAFLCHDIIWANRDILQRRGKYLHIGQGQALGQTTPPGSLVAEDGGHGMVSTPLAVPFYFPWNTRIEPLNLPSVEGISVAATVRQPAPPTPPGANLPEHLGQGACLHGPQNKLYRLLPAGTPGQVANLRPPSKAPRHRPGALPQPPACMGTSQQTPLLVRFRIL